jgi:hypothetical protein
MAILNALGRGAEWLGRHPKTMMGVGAAAFLGGVGSKVSPALRDAAMETAFDDPNADVSFLGRKFSGGYLLGAAMGGPMQTAMSIRHPGDYLSHQMPVGSPMVTGSIGAVAGTGIGAVAGASLGALAGFGASGMGAGLKKAAMGKNFPKMLAGPTSAAGSMIGFMGRRGKLAGGIMGTIGGLAIGGALGAFGPTAAYANENKRFFKESPYSPGTQNTSLGIANSLSASGDIVLGMHNSRRGY